MTTNVYDRVNGMLSTDARWSSENGDWIAYVDDTNYDKLAYISNVGFLFAGDLPPIDAWKTYVSGGMKKGTRPVMGAGLLPGTRIQIIQVELSSGNVKFQSHPFINTSIGALIRALFAGTGAPHAKACWDVRKCAVTAIDSAAKIDVRSGGSAIYLDRATRKNNVTNTAKAESVNQQLKDRGYFMHATQYQTPVLLKDAASDVLHPGHAFAKAVMSGAAPLTAPFPGMDEPWEDGKFAELDAALAEFEVD